MNLIAPKTFEIIKWVLKSPISSQRSVVKLSEADGDGVSLGQVNKVFKWLEQNEFIRKERTGRPVDDSGVHLWYRVVNPTGLIRAVSLFRSMERNRLATLDLDMDKKAVLEYLTGKKDVILCLDSALEIIDSYFRGDRICCYIAPPGEQVRLKHIIEELSSIPFGITRLEVFRWDFNGLDIFKAIHSDGNSTNDVQTIIDLFCDKRAYQTEVALKTLIENRWGSGGP